MMRLTAVCAAWLGFADAFLQPRPSSVLRQGRQKYDCPILSMTAISNNPDLQPGIDAIDAANPALFEKLSRLREDAYFRLYSVDILASCEYMPQELFECYSETCEIYPVDEDEVSYIQ
jgi:Endoplasmic Reticulum Oxidoreductin 1 (ERO1)